MLNLSTNYNLQPTIYQLIAWVKNVYSLCAQGAINSGNPSTHHLLITDYHQPTRVQPISFTQFINNLSPINSTAKNYLLSPTDYHLSPVSTAPTIKTTKKK